MTNDEGSACESYGAPLDLRDYSQQETSSSKQGIRPSRFGLRHSFVIRA
jgi:hypothetical protein